MKIISGNYKGLPYIYVNMPGFVTKFVAMAVNFGSKDCYIGERKLNNGIAHFLEHKLLMQKDLTDGYNVLNELGVRTNAYTTYERTVYYFHGIEIDAALKYLVRSYFNPYFDENDIEKEKKIIEREINMVNDNPEQILYQKVMSSCFINTPLMYSIAGEVSDIKNITPEELYLCHKYYYSKENSCLILVGDFNLEEKLELISEYIPENKNESVIRFDNYPLQVGEDVLLHGKVETPKFMIGLRIQPLHSFLDELEVKAYLFQLFGRTSRYMNKLLSENIITKNYDYYLTTNKDYALVMFEGEASNPDIACDEIIKLFKDNSLEIDEELSSIYLKNAKLENIRMLDSVFGFGGFVIDKVFTISNIESALESLLKLEHLNLSRAKKIVNSGIIVKGILKQ